MARNLIGLGVCLALFSGCGNHDRSDKYSASTTAPSTGSGGTTTPGPVTSSTPGTTTSSSTGGSTGSTGGGTTTPGLPPVLSGLVAPTASPASGNISFTYTLSDADSDPADLTVECSVDGGRTWRAASDAGPSEGSHGTSSLNTDPTGVAHTFVWASRADVGNHLRHFVKLRITPRDGNGTGIAGETAEFIVDDTRATTRLYNLVIPLDPQGPDSLSQFDVSNLGGLTRAPALNLATSGQGRQMSSLSGLVHAQGLVFASHNRSSGIQAFVVGANNQLSALPNGTVTTAGNPTQMAVTPDGRFLYTSNGTHVEGFAVGAAGLTPIAGSPFTVGSSPRGLVVHPRGDTLYTGHMFGGETGVRAHTIDATTGALTLASSLSLSSSGSRPGKHLRINPQGTLLFCSDLDNGLFALQIDATTRALTVLPGSPRSLSGFLSGAMTTTTRGDYLYVSVTGQGLHGFRVDARGGLTAVPGSPFPNVGGTTLYLETDPADAFLFAPSRTDDTLRVYAIDRASGVLTEAPGSPLRNPNTSGIAGPVLPLP